MRGRRLVIALTACAFMLTFEGCGLSALIGTGVALSVGGGSGGGAGVPPPVVTSVSPTSGSHQGGTTLTVTGSNFPSDATVSVGGVAATNVVVSGGGQLQA